MDMEFKIIGLLVLRICAAIFLFRRFRDQKISTTGYPLMYLVFTVLNDWIPALVSLAYQSPEETELAIICQTYQTYSFCAFVFGMLFPYSRERTMGRSLVAVSDEDFSASKRQIYFVGLAGLVIWLAIFPLVNGLPTATALASGGKNITLGALVAFYMFRSHSPGSLPGISSLAAAFAVATIVFMGSVILLGFSGYGLMIFAVLAALIARRMRRISSRVVPAAFLLGYFGLSMFQTYMRDRPAIRELVWGGAILSERAAQIHSTISNFEWFNPWNPEHQAVITSRLAQGWMFGRVVMNMEAGEVEYLWGQSIVEGFEALIPRVLWPEKPVLVGNADILAQYTGLHFNEDTSVGLGPSFEYYINFGIIGLLLGNFLMGLLVRHCDFQMAASIQQQNVTTFLCWCVLALSVVQTGRLAELTSSAGAAVAVAYGVCLVVKVISRQETGSADANELSSRIKKLSWVKSDQS